MSTVEASKQVRESNVPEVTEPEVAPTSRPTVEVFKEIVMRHCSNWSAVNVDHLCTDQTNALIIELAEHFA